MYARIALIFALVFAFLPPLGLEGVAAAAVTVTVVNAQAEHNLATWFNAAVGSSESKYAFHVTCQGADSIAFHVTNDNPHFTYSPSEVDYLVCGSSYTVSGEFTPTSSGRTVDHVVISGDFASVSTTVVGNGYFKTAVDATTVDLGQGNAIARILYDDVRGLIYMTDFENNSLLVFSPLSNTVIRRIPVGMSPRGMSFSSDRSFLYVTNSEANTVSKVDLTSQQPVETLVMPAEQYMPWDLAMLGEARAIYGQTTPGLSLAGVLQMVDLSTMSFSNLILGENWEHSHIPVFRFSRDFTTVALLAAPEFSPSRVARYDIASGSGAVVSLGIERGVEINRDGSVMAVTQATCNMLSPDMQILDARLAPMKEIELSSCASTGVVFDPVNPDLLYSISDQVEETIDGRILATVSVASIALGVQIRTFTVEVPKDYYPLTNSLVISPDGKVLYSLLGQVWNEPPGKLFIMKVPATDPNNLFGTSELFIPAVSRP